MKQVMTVFERRLEATDVGPDDDFFKVGGSSFLAALCISDLRKRDVTVAIQDLFVAKTAKALAQRIQPLQKVT